MKYFYSIFILMTIGILTVSAQVAVIVNKSNTVSKITSDELKNIYMLSTIKWSNGTRIVVIDNREKSLQEKFFSFLDVSDILSVKKQWMRYQLSGEGKAPTIADGVQEILDKVASTPGAIGYVRLSDVKGSDVKVIAKIE